MALLLLDSDDTTNPGEYFLISMEVWEKFKQDLKDVGLYADVKKHAQFELTPITLHPKWVPTLPSDKGEWLSLKAAAAAAGISEITLRRWVAREKVTPLRQIGGPGQHRWRFTHEDVSHLRLLAMSNAALGASLGVTERTYRRMVSDLRKENPHLGRLELLLKLHGTN